MLVPIVAVSREPQESDLIDYDNDPRERRSQDLNGVLETSRSCLVDIVPMVRAKGLLRFVLVTIDVNYGLGAVVHDYGPLDRNRGCVFAMITSLCNVIVGKCPHGPR